MSATADAGLVLRDRRELCDGSHVARRPDARRRGAQVLVHGDPAPGRLDADGLEVELLDIRHAARREQHPVRVTLVRFRAVARRDRRDHLVAFLAQPLDEDIRRELDPLCLQRRRERRRGVGIGERRDPLGRVRDPHLGAEARERLAELEPHRAAADDEQRARNLVQVERRGRDRASRSRRFLRPAARLCASRSRPGSGRRPARARRRGACAVR